MKKPSADKNKKETKKRIWLTSQKKTNYSVASLTTREGNKETIHIKSIAQCTYDREQRIDCSEMYPANYQR